MNALRIPAFRRLWVGLGLSSLGDWLGLLALTAMANQLADGYAAKNYAIAGVLFLRVLPAIVFGPLAGYVADRVDRRTVLVWGDYARGALFLTIPLVGTLWWVFVVTVLVEIISLLWLPAKDATVPNLVPRHLLEQANQISIATTYGSAVPAAALFALLTALGPGRSRGDGLAGPRRRRRLALRQRAVLHRLRHRHRAAHRHPLGAGGARGRGQRVAGHRQRLGLRRAHARGRVPWCSGMAGAFAAGGVVVGLARTYVADLGAGDAGYGVLFGAVFVGMGAGLWRGPRVLSRVSRRRVFGVALTGAGVLLLPLALVPHLEVVAALAVGVGFLAGAAWVTGMTLLGLEVPDELRGRTFAFVATLVRLVLALVLAVAPLLAGADRRRQLRSGGRGRPAAVRVPRRRAHDHAGRCRHDGRRCARLSSDERRGRAVAGERSGAGAAGGTARPRRGPLRAARRLHRSGGR